VSYCFVLLRRIDRGPTPHSAISSSVHVSGAASVIYKSLLEGIAMLHILSTLFYSALLNIFGMADLRKN
jgi:hypothetical protein